MSSPAFHESCIMVIGKMGRFFTWGSDDFADKPLGHDRAEPTVIASLRLDNDVFPGVDDDGLGQTVAHDVDLNPLIEVIKQQGDKVFDVFR